MAKGRLEGRGSPRDRHREARVRGRDGGERLSSPALRLVTEGREGTLQGAAQPRTRHHATGEHDGRGHGTVPSSGRRDHQERLRALPGGGSRPEPSARAGGGGDGQPLCPHRGGRVRELLEGAGCELLYLPPPYSPDLSPIEEAFSKVEGLLRKAEARSREALVEAMGQALDAVTARDARGFFEHCGCRASGQLL